MEDNFKSEFFFQTENGEDVVVAMGVVMDGTFAIEDVSEGFESEVTFEGFLGIVFFEMFGAFLLVGLGIEEFLADEGGGLSSGAGEGAGFADRVGAVGHLDPTGVGSVFQFDGEVFDGISFAEFEVDCLAGEEVAGARHEIDGGDAAGAGFIDRGVTDVDGIHNTDFGLDGR